MHLSPPELTTFLRSTGLGIEKKKWRQILGCWNCMTLTPFSSTWLVILSDKRVAGTGRASLVTEMAKWPHVGSIPGLAVFISFVCLCLKDVMCASCVGVFNISTSRRMNDFRTWAFFIPWLLVWRSSGTLPPCYHQTQRSLSTYPCTFLVVRRYFAKLDVVLSLVYFSPYALCIPSIGFYPCGRFSWSDCLAADLNFRLLLLTAML